VALIITVQGHRRAQGAARGLSLTLTGVLVVPIHGIERKRRIRKTISMPLRTRLTEKLGISHPILFAPMGTASGGALAEAVTEAGCLRPVWQIDHTTELF
jgi:hypothetical protein